MGFQLRSEAVGTAIAVLIYTIICLFFSVLTLFLAWVHEGMSYVALLAISCCISGISCFARQINTMINWRDVVEAGWEYEMKNPTNPRTAVFGVSTDLNLVLLSIQMYTFNVQSFLIACWAVELCLSVFPVTPPKMYGRVRNIAKSVAILLPALQIGLLHLEALQKTVVGYFVIANGIMAIGLVVGTFLLLAILFRYIYIRRQSALWKPTSTWGENNSTSVPHLNGLSGTYDRWLVTRFTIAFITLGTFESVMVLFQIMNLQNTTRDLKAKQPDFGVHEAKMLFISVIPEVTAGLFTFVMFGTTRLYRNYMWEKFAPKCMKRPRRRRNRHLAAEDLLVTDPRRLGASSEVPVSPLDPNPGMTTTEPKRAWTVSQADRQSTHSTDDPGV